MLSVLIIGLGKKINCLVIVEQNSVTELIIKHAEQT
ncbi:hypothetical protein GGGNBK_12610 [Sporosarcina sp. ANT_H38]